MAGSQGRRKGWGSLVPRDNRQDTDRLKPAAVDGIVRICSNLPPLSGSGSHTDGIFLCRYEKPMQITHDLEISVYFSVDGEDAAGKPLRVGGPGELRAMRITRSIPVPSVGVAENN